MELMERQAVIFSPAELLSTLAFKLHDCSGNGLQQQDFPRYWLEISANVSWVQGLEFLKSGKICHAGLDTASSSEYEDWIPGFHQYDEDKVQPLDFFWESSNHNNPWQISGNFIT